MADTSERQADDDAAGDGDEAAPQSPSSLSLLLLLTGAVICWGASLALPGRPPILRTDSADNWIFFGERILRDTLRALSIVAVAMALAARVPQIGLLIERVVLGSRRRVFLPAAAGLAILSSGLFSYYVLGHMPHIQDEVAMLFQAKVLASGRLYAEAPALPEFFDCEFVVVDGPRWYGKYFLTQSLPLVPGVWLGVPWLVHPLLAGAAVGLAYALGRALLSEKVARVAAVLLVISPFRVSLFGMMMSHASCLVMLALFALGVVKVVRDPARSGWAFVAGLGLGSAGNCRPLTALAMGPVITLAALWVMPWSRLTWRTAASFLLAVGLCGLVFLGYNKALTGDALLTPFNQWSTSDRLGFGPDVGLEYWRESDRGHTLRKALLKDTHFNLDVLGLNLTGWGRVTLLLLIWPLIRSPWPKRSWALAAVLGSLIVAHLFHVSHGVLAGQARYWSEAMPMTMLLLAIALVNVRRSLPPICRWLDVRPAVRTGRSACWLAAGMLTLWSIKIAYLPLIDECKQQFWGQGPTVRELARAEKLDHALVFMKTGHYRTHFRGGDIDLYPCGFMLNDPDLAGPVVYARDLGDERNAALIARYPDRSVYRIDPSAGRDIRFIPVSTPATRAGP